MHSITQQHVIAILYLVKEPITQELLTAIAPTFGCHDTPQSLRSRMVELEREGYTHRVDRNGISSRKRPCWRWQLTKKAKNSYRKSSTPQPQTKGNETTMATNPFIVTIKNEETLACQNTYTGLFYAIKNDGKHTPIDYQLIRTQTTSMQRLKYWRNRYGYTQADLAELVHVSSKTVIELWETGLRYPCKKYRQLINAELAPDIFTD